jgi:hypothetical protein
MHDAFNFIKSTAVVWGPFISGLIAAFIVHLLTQSREREKWILDCKKQEFKELLSALAMSYIMTINTHSSPIRVVDPDDQRKLDNVVIDALRVMNDRIYVADDLPLEEFGDRWSRACSLYAQRKQLSEEYAKISGTIVDAANRCVPKSTIKRCLFWRR